jgi:hypothetical protein
VTSVNQQSVTKKDKKEIVLDIAAIMSDIQSACKISEANGNMVQIGPGAYPASCTMGTGSF